EWAQGQHLGLTAINS
ncbi:hypothetical protein ACMTAU_21245, partial [Alcaligenes pakistanensis]